MSYITVLKLHRAASGLRLRSTKSYASKLLEVESLLVEMLREDRRTNETPAIDVMRAIRQRDIDRLDAGVRRLINPHTYHVSLSGKLWDLKQELIKSAQAQHAVR